MIPTFVSQQTFPRKKKHNAAAADQRRLMKRVQVLMSPACHRVLKQICAIDDVSMSEFMHTCARKHIHQRAKTDDHILTLLQREGIELDP